MIEKSKVTLPAKVEKIIPSQHPREPEKAQVRVEGADPLYEELRVENSLTDEKGNQVRLKKDADVTVTIEADKAATLPKK
jgi:hypothetical protein